VTVEGTMCKTVFAGKFIDLFVVVLTLFTGGYFHLRAELLSIAHPHPKARRPCVSMVRVTEFAGGTT
jgi:hypothetical protein